MKVGLISDTHGYLDPKVLHYFADVDEVWHAGDVGNTEICDQLETFKPMRAVWGNIDSKEIRWRYPEIIRFDCEGLRVFMIHIATRAGRSLPAYRQEIIEEKPDILICGHSHIIKVYQDPKIKMIYINPGAAGNQGWHKKRTIMTFELINKKIENMKVIELGARGR